MHVPLRRWYIAPSSKYGIDQGCFLLKVREFANNRFESLNEEEFWKYFE